MGQRLGRLERMEELYALLEDTRSAELQRAASLLRETEATLGEQLVRGKESHQQAREALLQGDAQQRMLAETQERWCRQLSVRLEEMRCERETLTEIARAQYGESRRQREQMKSLTTGIRQEEEYRAVRHVQLAADERFLARLHWNEHRYKGI